MFQIANKRFKCIRPLKRPTRPQASSATSPNDEHVSWSFFSSSSSTSRTRLFLLLVSVVVWFASLANFVHNPGYATQRRHDHPCPKDSRSRFLQRGVTAIARSARHTSARNLLLLLNGAPAPCSSPLCASERKRANMDVGRHVKRQIGGAVGTVVSGQRWGPFDS